MRVKYYHLPPPKKSSPPPKKRKTVSRPKKTFPKKKTTPRKKTPKKKDPPKTPKPTPRRTPEPAYKPPRPRPTPYRPSHTPRPEPTRAPSPPPGRAPLQITHENLPSYYLLMATQKIESNFKLTRSNRYSGLTATIQFRVNREGDISEIKVIRSTGQASLDRFAMEAVERTETLGPLPDSIRGGSIVITANFDYSPGEH